MKTLMTKHIKGFEKSNKTVWLLCCELWLFLFHISPLLTYVCYFSLTNSNWLSIKNLQVSISKIILISTNF